MHLRRVLSLALGLVVVLCSLARAADTGSVSGGVFTPDGTGVADATVKISGERLPGGRTARTDASGMYNFQLLLPGRYTVEVDAPGIGQTSRAVIVEVDKNTQVDLMPGVTLKEELTVSAAAPTVDMQSTEVNFNYKSDTIAALPLERTYAGLFQLIPGVADNNSFAPNGGGSRQDNTYLVDGVNVTNPGFGYLSTEMNEFDIVEFNVKRAGISAEFGRSSGFVTNAVTRSGTNQLSGGIRFEAIPLSFVASPKSKSIQNTSDRYVTSLGFGGPILLNRLFWYGSAQVVRQTTADRRNNFGDLPDRKESVSELFGKITAAPSNEHFFNASYRRRPQETRFANIGVNDSPALGTHTKGTNRVATASWNWFPNSKTTFEVKYLRLDEPNETVAVTDLGFQPAFTVNNLAAMGSYFDPVANQTVGGASQRFSTQNYNRNEVRATVSRFADFAKASHHLKAGFTWEDTTEDLTRLSNGWGSISLVQNNTQVQARYYPTQPSQLSKGRTYSLFVQDDLTITPRLVVNAGLLVTRDEFAQQLDSKNTFLTFGFGKELQPRLGANYNLRKGKNDKIYGNYGRYYNLDQKSGARSMAPKNLYQNDALFDRATGALLSDSPLSNATGKVIDPGVKPPYFDEYMIGYATPLPATWSLDVFFMYRNGGQFIEDVPRVLPTSSFWYTNIDAERKYRALTMELNRPLANRWSLNLSYALSKMYGNFELDGTGSTGIGNDGTQYNTSSFLQDGPGIFVQDPYRYGPLNQDRTHVFKALGTYAVTSRVQLGANLRVQSGTPWAAMGRDWYGGYRRFLEPAGTRRNDTWANVDVLAAYRLPFAEKYNILLEARVLNLFNTQTALFRDLRQYLDGRIREFSATPTPGCFECYTDLMIQGTTQPNPRFGEPTEYADPRRLLLSAKFNF
jgi:hypothetical protein